MKYVYTCDKCNLEMFSEADSNYGRCPQCGHLLYPDGYTKHPVSDEYYDGAWYKLHPAPSWDIDRKG